MIDLTGKAYQLAISVFVISTTIGQVAAIDDKKLKALILLPTLCAWGYWFYCYKRYRHFTPSKRQITTVSELLKGTREIQSRHVRDEAELHRVWLCDTLAYGEGNFDFEQTLSWWEKYPFSPYVLFEGGVYQERSPLVALACAPPASYSIGAIDVSERARQMPLR